MPFDSGTTYKKNYNMHYHEVPRYLNAACIPFTQEYFSQNEYDQIRYSSYVNGPMNAVK